MALKEGFTKGDNVFSILDKERQAIWRAHPNWSEEDRLAAWSQRQSEIASYLYNNSATPRHLPDDLRGSSSQARGSGQERGVRGFPLVLTGSH